MSRQLVFGSSSTRTVLSSVPGVTVKQSVVRKQLYERVVK
jgi:hypothetical protein